MQEALDLIPKTAKSSGERPKDGVRSHLKKTNMEPELRGEHAPGIQEPVG